MADPNEQNNLWESMPDKVDELKAAHAAYLKANTIDR